MKKEYNLLLILFIFFLINIILNFSFLKELFGNKMLVTDNITTEYLVETSYQSILHFKNPFITKTILYPFTTNYSMEDPNTFYVLPFFLLRPFLDAHKSFIIIVLVDFFLNNAVMYLLLRKLKIEQNLSVIMALVFGFTPFLSHRVLGHYTYIPIYFFPLVFLIALRLFETKITKEKYLFSLILGLSMALILMSVFYYCIMITLGFIFYAGYWFLVDRKRFLKTIKKNILYICLSAISAIFILLPWILSVYRLIKTQGLAKTPGFGGAVALSSDVLSFFTPSEYNPIYKFFFSKLASITSLLSKYNNFFLNSWERFSYPGIIIVITYLLIIFFKFFTKKFPKELWRKISPYFFISLAFSVLMLGPFLKIFNHWSVNLDGVTVVFPLPFLLFHYLPGFTTFRASSRFTPIFVFFACLVAAYVINYFYKKTDKSKKLMILVSLLIVFFIDQIYIIPSQIKQTVPSNIYQYLKNKKDRETVLEIPFTVRDGFQYIGFVHAIQPMYGQIIHGKPVMGGYISRIPEEIFSYYRNLKFIDYLASIIDKGNYDSLKEKPGEIKFYTFPYSIDTAKKEIKSFNIKYVILKDDEKYSNYLLNLFRQMGFIEKQEDYNYLLLER